MIERYRLALDTIVVPLVVLLIVALLALLPSKSYALSSTRTSVTLLRIGTRPSNLALIQAKEVEIALLDAIKSTNTDNERELQTEIVAIDASGDKKEPIASTQDVPLAMTAVDFTGSLDDALIAGTIDAAVHSTKDLPPANRWRDGLTIACHIGPRADPCDVLVGSYSSFAELPRGARVGSASIRRQAQLLSHRPDVTVVNLRGNVQARLAALENGDVDALILAAAGLDRLESGNSHGKRIDVPKYHKVPVENMLPGAAQGIVCVTCRADDNDVLSLLQRIDNKEARIAATAERALLDVVDKGVQHKWPGRPPVAAYMLRDDDGWTLRGLLATPNGSKVIRTLQRETIDCSNERASELGELAGRDLLNEAGTTFLAGYG